MVASAIVRAVRECGLPEGVFSLLNGTSYELGGSLVRDTRIKAAAFTGSRGGGLALMRIAAERAVPIPVYAEMSAVNPVLLMPGALADRAKALGEQYAASLSMGAGQFCTNPGLVLAIESPDLDTFIGSASHSVSETDSAVMLTRDIHKAYEEGLKTLADKVGIEVLARGVPTDQPNRSSAALFSISVEHFVNDHEISEEVFGASSVLVRCADAEAMERALENLEGQLTATLHFADSDHVAVAKVLPALQMKAGRVIANGWPTGVEVSHAMVHGGPFPATSDGRSTSVGTLAIERFLRPVCYQGFPESLLPAPLKDGAQAGIPHRLDGKVTV
jgi:NADP-dependent aldehyde dehydrogenase